MNADVLIVEDHADLAEDRERYLKAIPAGDLSEHGITGFRIFHAGSGTRARELLRTGAEPGKGFHVVLLDLHLPEQEGGRYQSLEVGFNLLNLATMGGAAKRTLAVSAFDEEIVKALRGGVTDFMPKPIKGQDLRNRFLVAWKSLIEAESESLRAARIKQLLPQAQLSWATQFSSCFSEFLRAVARTNEDLRAGLSERLDVDFDRDGNDPVVRDVQRLTEVIQQAKQSWGTVTGEMRPVEKTANANLETAVREAVAALEPCFISRRAKITNRAADSAEVAVYGQDLSVILRELVLGPLAEDPQTGAKIQVNVSAERADPWIRLRVRDDGSPLSGEDMTAINGGFPLMPGDGFGRAWGLSIVQHTAIRNGGKLSVSTSDSMNEVTYQIPLAQ